MIVILPQTKTTTVSWWRMMLCSQSILTNSWITKTFLRMVWNIYNSGQNSIVILFWGDFFEFLKHTNIEFCTINWFSEADWPKVTLDSLNIQKHDGPKSNPQNSTRKIIFGLLNFGALKLIFGLSRHSARSAVYA